MTRYDKVSISLPHDLLVLARSSHLQAPGEGLSPFFARLLKDALDRRDREADELYPPTAEEQAVSDAFLRATLHDLENDPGPDVPSTRRRARS